MCLGVPGKITSIYTSGTLTMARMDFGGVTREACIEALPEAQIGDWAIIHAGFALNLLSEEEAQETLTLLRELAAFEEQLAEDVPGQPTVTGG